MNIKLMSHPDYSSPLSVQGHAYISSTNLSNIAALPPCVLIVDVFVHLGYELEGYASELELTLEDQIVVNLTQQGGFVLHTGPTDPDEDFGIVTIEGAVHAPLNAKRWTQNDVDVETYPGSFFRFSGYRGAPDDHRNLWNVQVRLLKVRRVIASWFGLPNSTTNVNNNAWLLRKAILAAEAIYDDQTDELLVPARPVYIPPDTYKFDDDVFSENNPLTSPIRLRGSQAGSSTISTVDDTENRIELFTITGTPANPVQGMSIEHLFFDARDIAVTGQPGQLLLIPTYVDGLNLSFLRFSHGNDAIRAQAVKNAIISHNEFSGQRNYSVRCMPNIYSDGTWYPSTDVIVANSIFSNPSMYRAQATIAFRPMSNQVFQLGDSIHGRMARLIIAGNHLANLATAGIRIGALCGNAIGVSNIVHYPWDNRNDEPMTVGGQWPPHKIDLETTTASVNTFSYVGNVVVNDRIRHDNPDYPPPPQYIHPSCCILIWCQAVNGLIAYNDIYGGKSALRFGAGDVGNDPDPEENRTRRINKHLLLHANLGTKNLEPDANVSTEYAQVTKYADATSNDLKNNLVTNAAVDPALSRSEKEYLAYKDNMSEEISDNFRSPQDWQPGNDIQGADPYYDLDSEEAQLKPSAWLVQPRNFFCVYHKATSTVTLNGMLAFAKIPENDVDIDVINQRIGSAETASDPDPYFSGLRCEHLRDIWPAGPLHHRAYLEGSAAITAGVVVNPIVRAVVNSSPTVATVRSDFELIKADWDEGLLKLEDLYLWVRADGRIGVKQQSSPPAQDPPTSDTDGTLIPIQADAVTDMETTYTWKEIAERLNDLLGKLRTSGSIAA
ncbi:hypothetical protein BMS3Bbin04_01274 [bacterium BMS3Bbin04]|nr:hypothetical protein BMS3Bbin04_01274 [bacterium BMS3Bbin04]